MTKPLWSEAERLAAEALARKKELEAKKKAEAEAKAAAAALDRLFAFKETARHSTYGGYGYVGASRMNKATHDAIVQAHNLAGQKASFSQGGLNGGAVSASASTHNGLGVADTRTTSVGISLAEAKRIVSYGFECGAIGMIRGMGGPDNMVPHIHWVMYDMRSTQHSSTEDQLYANYWGVLDGGGGLGGARNARWWGPERKKPVRWSDSKYNPKNGWKP